MSTKRASRDLEHFGDGMREHSWQSTPARDPGAEAGKRAPRGSGLTRPPGGAGWVLVLLVCVSLCACRSARVEAGDAARAADARGQSLSPAEVVAWVEPADGSQRFARRTEPDALRPAARPGDGRLRPMLTPGAAVGEEDVRARAPRGENTLEEEIAETDGDDLSKASQNPLADLISVPLQGNINISAGPFDRTTTVFNLQPVVPIPVSSRWNLVTRTIIPLLNQGHVESADGTTAGLGDINPTAWLTPAKPGKLIWGAGASFTLPTATESRLGSGKWVAGPSVVLLTMPGKWVIGGLAAQTWSFAGDDSRADVNLFFSQIFVTYNIRCGWFLTSAPIITANWNATGEKWTLPVGAGFGRVMKVGKRPVNWSLHAYYNAVRPELAADWQVRVQLALLFPK